MIKKILKFICWPFVKFMDWLKSGLPKDELDKGGACVCDNCECKNGKDRAEDSTYENNGGIVIDDTEECESCQ